MKYYVYILRSLKDGKRYIGFTSDLQRRLTEHNSEKVKSTKNRKPFELIYTETFENKSDAMKREKFFKTHQGRNYLDSINK
jgi:putative endonuclease